MKKEFQISIVCMLCLFVAACGSTNKTVAPSASSEALDELIATKQFNISVDWVRPMMTTSMNSVLLSGLRPPGSSSNRINVMGNGNYLQLNGDQVVAHLPFWGERQMGGGTMPPLPESNSTAFQRILKSPRTSKSNRPILALVSPKKRKPFASILP